MGSSDGISNDDTLLEDSRPVRRSQPLSLQGYEVGTAIGEGGMGEVLLARDPKIGRDVAIKRMRGAEPSPEHLERFLREAKIQARLDHPAIVPVYELGSDREGNPYFTMKRLSGATLSERIAAAPALQPLLRAFVDVCQAIDFAHARGVVHRDLKPANIMLGDYGEVYVLDWGVARIVTRERAITEPGAASPSVSREIGTQAGALLGTPGYMAPEQTRGEAVAFSADIYSLGCILFEILTGEALHPRGTGAIANTLANPTEAPSHRKPERAIAPELDEACRAALAGDPRERPTARELEQRVQRYLDGDRDHERRAELAAELVVRARALASDPEKRADAIRDAGRALALDPDSQDAAALVMTLMLEPPEQLPATLSTHLARIDVDSTTQSARIASIALSSSFLLLPVAIWLGVTSWPAVLAVFALLGTLAVHAGFQAYRRRIHLLIPFVAGTLLLFLFSRLMGSLVLLPTMIVVFVVGLGSQPQLLRRPALVLGTGLSTFLVPIVLERLDVFERTWWFEGDRLEVTSRLVHLSGAPAYVLLLAANLLMIVLMFVFVRSLTVSRRDARHQLEVQAWQLRQLLPAPPPSAELEAAIAADCR